MPDTGYITANSVEDALGGTIIFSGWTSDDDTLTRIRDGQTATALFGGLSGQIPAGATILGIEVRMDASMLNGGEALTTGPWLKVNNGSSTSTAKSTSSGGTWVTFDGLSGSSGIRIAGGSSDLWGLSWNPTTAAGIKVIANWSTTNGDAYYLDYIQVKIHYTTAVIATYDNSSDEQTISNGTIAIKKGLLKF